MGCDLPRAARMKGAQHYEVKKEAGVAALAQAIEKGARPAKSRPFFVDLHIQPLVQPRFAATCTSFCGNICSLAKPRIALLLQEDGAIRMSKKEYTSKSVASKASKILSDPKASKIEKSVAGSALTQARDKKKR